MIARGLLAAALALLLTAPAAEAAKPRPPRGAYTCYVFEIFIGPDGGPVAGPTASVIGRLRLGKARYRSKLGRGHWRYSPRRGRPVFRTGPLKGRKVDWDPRRKDKVWRIELKYRGERHFCDRKKR